MNFQLATSLQNSLRPVEPERGLPGNLRRRCPFQSLAPGPLDPSQGEDQACTWKRDIKSTPCEADDVVGGDVGQRWAVGGDVVTTWWAVMQDTGVCH